MINIISFGIYYIDKEKAKKNKWRISENTLLLFALIGGSIGAYLSMYIFRHKTKHLKFTFGIPLIVIIQLIIYIYIRGI